MFAKVQITGILEVVTGLHIGGSGVFSAIGAVDSPVVKDARTNSPMIPGSSFKGKLRALLAKQYNGSKLAPTPDDDADCLTSLFGNSKKHKRSRVIFSDMIMSNWEELKALGLESNTEIKFENSIKRTTGVANPRQIERVIRGAEFPVNIIYEVSEDADMEKDFEILKNGLILLQYDYLGGSGTRGYGKVKFKEFELTTVVGEVDDNLIEACQKLLQEV